MRRILHWKGVLETRAAHSQQVVEMCMEDDINSPRMDKLCMTIICFSFHHFQMSAMTLFEKAVSCSQFEVNSKASDLCVHLPDMWVLGLNPNRTWYDTGLF